MKKLFSLLLVSGIMLFNAGISLAYNDTGGHWAEDYIKMLSEPKVVNGYPDGSFKPDNNVTRAELAKVMALDRFGSLDDFWLKRKENPDFSDMVGSNHWASKYIKVARGKGSMKGYPDGTFRPDNYVTRAEVAAVIGNEYKYVNPTISYTDIDSEDWYYWYILRSGYMKVMGGYPDGTFRPNELITRAELAKVMAVENYNFYIPSPEEAANPYEWNPGVKELFEQIMIEWNYFDSASDIVYEEAGVNNGRGNYYVYDQNGRYIVRVDCKTGWFHG